MVSIREHGKSVTSALKKDCETYSDIFLVFRILQKELGIKKPLIVKKRKELSKALFRSIVKFILLRDDASFFQAKSVYNTNSESLLGNLLTKVFKLSFIRKFLASNFSFLLSEHS